MKKRKNLKHQAPGQSVQPGQTPKSERRFAAAEAARLDGQPSGQNGEAEESLDALLRRDFSALEALPGQPAPLREDTRTLVQTVTKLISGQEGAPEGKAGQQAKKIEAVRVQAASETDDKRVCIAKVDLSRFDDKPFVPPTEDPTLEELFGRPEQKADPSARAEGEAVASPSQSPEPAVAGAMEEKPVGLGQKPLETGSETAESAPEPDAPLPAQMGTENTGPLPSLEELFGAEAVLASSLKPISELEQAPVKRRRRLRAMLSELGSSGKEACSAAPNAAERRQDGTAEISLTSPFPGQIASAAETQPAEREDTPELTQSALESGQSLEERQKSELSTDERVPAEPEAEQDEGAGAGRSGSRKQARSAQKQRFDGNSKADSLSLPEEVPQTEEAIQEEKAPRMEQAVQTEEASQAEEELLLEEALLFDLKKIYRWTRGIFSDLNAVVCGKKHKTEAEAVAEPAPSQAPAERPAPSEAEAGPALSPVSEALEGPREEIPVEAAEPAPAEVRSEFEALSGAEICPVDAGSPPASAEAQPAPASKQDPEPAASVAEQANASEEKRQESPEFPASEAADSEDRRTEAKRSEAGKMPGNPVAVSKNGKKKKKNHSNAKASGEGKTQPTANSAAAIQKEEKEQKAGKSEFSEPVVSASVRAQGHLKIEEPPREPELPELPEPEITAQSRAEEIFRLYAKPLDQLSVRLILTGLLSMLSLFFTLYLNQKWTFLPQFFSSGSTVYVLLVLLGGMVLVNRKLYFVQWRGKHGLRVELLIVIATLFTALDCINAAKTLRPPYQVVVGILLLIELWGEYDRGLGMTTTLKVLRGESLSAGVSEVPEISKGQRGLVRSEPDVDAFLENLQMQDLVDKTMSVYTPVAMVVGLLLTLFITLQLEQDLFWTGSLIFLGSVPVLGLLAYPRLFYQLAERLGTANAALCGYYGAEVFGGEHAILIGDEDVFPHGSLSLNGFKVYSGNPTYVISLAAAAFRESGSALNPVFEDLLVTHNGQRFRVDNFRFYDSGGIGASIRQDIVLLGSLEFMRRMGVHMDRGVKVKQAVYMSLNGELAAVFAVRYLPPENLHKGLSAIAGNRHFKGILVTRTFLGTPGFFKAKFGIPTGAFLYPGTKERVRLSESEIKRSGPQGAILAQDSFSGFAQAAAGGRMLRSATLGAAILSVLGGVGGLLLMGVLAALPAYETATALNLAFYVTAWLAPTLLLTTWGRHF